MLAGRFPISGGRISKASTGEHCNRIVQSGCAACPVVLLYLEHFKNLRLISCTVTERSAVKNALIVITVFATFCQHQKPLGVWLTKGGLHILSDYVTGNIPDLLHYLCTGAPTPAHAPGPAASAAHNSAHARRIPPMSTALGRKLQQSWYNAFSAKDLATIFGTADESAAPALVAPEEEEAPAPAPAAAAAANAPILAPGLMGKLPPSGANPPAQAPAAAPSSPHVTYPPVDTIAPTDLMSLFAGYTRKEGGPSAARAEGRKLRSVADVFSPAKLEAIFGPPGEEEAEAPTAAAVAAPAPSARGRAAGRQLRHSGADGIVTEDEILQKALNVALADTQAEMARMDFYNSFEQVAVAPGPGGQDSDSRRRLQQDYNAPDFPRAIFDMAMKLAPSYNPVQPEAAGVHPSEDVVKL